MKSFLWILACCLILKGVHSIQFYGTNVPNMIVIDDFDDDGDVDEHDVEKVILDCDYKLEPTDKGNFVLKWFKDGQLIYQWIKGKMPTVFPRFKDKIDESYEASEDPDYKYKSILLENLSIEDSGSYKCTISAFDSNFQLEKTLHIIDVSNMTINLNTPRRDNETHLECTVENVYPEPTVIVTTEDDDDIPPVTKNVKKNENGFYTATTIAILDNSLEDDDESYKCIVEFANLPFNRTKSNSNSSPDSLKGSMTTLSFLLLIPFLAMF